MSYPKIYLALDNCFAIKRWVHPRDWMKVISDIGGIKYIEASTDNEIDPLFTTKKYRQEWTSDVKRLESELNLKICSFFSGYATYRTCGLTHWDKSTRDKLRREYFNNVVQLAREFDAHVGCILNSFPETILEQPENYYAYTSILEKELAKMAKYAAHHGVLFCYEQMYSPNLGFWLIHECRDWLNKIYSVSEVPMYIAIDTAHQTGQKKYLKPAMQDIEKSVLKKETSKLWLGNAIQEKIRNNSLGLDELKTCLNEYRYLFSSVEDGDLYEWLAQLGCYSPVIHLQQTDGTFSAHKPFTKQWNEDGIVKPDQVLRAIAKSYEQKNTLMMPPKTEKIFLVFELFFGISERAEYIIDQIRESIDYWRLYIPEDGLVLDALIEKLNVKDSIK